MGFAWRGHPSWKRPIDAAIRETKEEAGITIVIDNIIALWGIPYGEKWSIEALVEARYVSGEVKLSEEHSSFQWVAKKALLVITPQSKNLKPFTDYLKK